MREPSRPLRRSIYNFTTVRTSMKPSVTMSTKIRLEMAQKMKVCWGSAGPYLPKLKEPCQTTSATDIASRTMPQMKRTRFRTSLNYSGAASYNGSCYTQPAAT